MNGRSSCPSAFLDLQLVSLVPRLAAKGLYLKNSANYAACGKMDTASVYSPLDKKDITFAEWYSPFDGDGCQRGLEGGAEGVWVHGGTPVFGFGPQSFKG